MLVPFTTSLSQQASFACPIGNDAQELEVRKSASPPCTSADNHTI